MMQIDSLVVGFEDLDVFDYHIVAEDPCKATLPNTCQATASHCDVICLSELGSLCTGFCDPDPGIPTVGHCKCKKL